MVGKELQITCNTNIDSFRDYTMDQINNFYNSKQLVTLKLSDTSGLLMYKIKENYMSFYNSYWRRMLTDVFQTNKDIELTCQNVIAPDIPTQTYDSDVYFTYYDGVMTAFKHLDQPISYNLAVTTISDYQVKTYPAYSEAYEVQFVQWLSLKREVPKTATIKVFFDYFISDITEGTILQLQAYIFIINNRRASNH